MSESAPRITTPKLVDLAPTWAPFAGWTILFDNPGVSGRDDGPIEVLDCPRGCAVEQELFDELGDWAAETLAELLGEIAHAPLPRPTYHVTVADGISVGHLPRLEPDDADRCARQLSDLSDALLRGELPLEPAAWRDLLEPLPAPVRFVVDRVDVRGHGVLALLTAAREQDEQACEEIRMNRARPLEHLGRVLGLELVSDWEPHVTLAYLADRNDASVAAERIRADPPVFESAIQFASMSVYGFSSMVEYRRLAPKRSWRTRLRRVRSH